VPTTFAKKPRELVLSEAKDDVVGVRVFSDVRSLSVESQRANRIGYVLVLGGKRISNAEHRIARMSVVPLFIRVPIGNWKWIETSLQYATRD